MYKKEYIDGHPLVLCDFCLEKIVTCDFDLLDIFHDDQRLYPSKSVRLSNNKTSFGYENKKLISELASANIRKFSCQDKKLLALAADPSSLF